MFVFDRAAYFLEEAGAFLVSAVFSTFLAVAFFRLASMLASLVALFLQPLAAFASS